MVIGVERRFAVERKRRQRERLVGTAHDLKADHLAKFSNPRGTTNGVLSRRIGISVRAVIRDNEAVEPTKRRQGERAVRVLSQGSSSDQLPRFSTPTLNTYCLSFGGRYPRAGQPCGPSIVMFQRSPLNSNLTSRGCVCVFFFVHGLPDDVTTRISPCNFFVRWSRVSKFRAAREGRPAAWVERKQRFARWTRKSS